MSHLQSAAWELQLTATPARAAWRWHPAASLRHVAQCTNFRTVNGRAVRLAGHPAALLYSAEIIQGHLWVRWKRALCVQTMAMDAPRRAAQLALHPYNRKTAVEAIRCQSPRSQRERDHARMGQLGSTTFWPSAGQTAFQRRVQRRVRRRQPGP